MGLGFKVQGLGFRVMVFRGFYIGVPYLWQLPSQHSQVLGSNSGMRGRSVPIQLRVCLFCPTSPTKSLVVGAVAPSSQPTPELTRSPTRGPGESTVLSKGKLGCMSAWW